METNKSLSSKTKIKTKKDVVNIIASKCFDPFLKDYYSDLIQELMQKEILVLANQYFYYFDFFEKRMIHTNSNITKILGYDLSIESFSFLYDIIHPADRIMVYAATLKSIEFASPKFKLKPFEDNFLIDFRMKHKKGHYLRILRQTGCAVVDKQYNMVVSYAMNTDISKIKTTSAIGLDYRGSHDSISYPDHELLELKSLFSKREKEILYHLCNGKTSTQISSELFLSKHTVDTHRRNMLRKAMLKNTPELIIYGLENGLV